MAEFPLSHIHPALTRDCIVLGRFELCYLLLMNDSNYPWFILVPDRENIREIHELQPEDQQQLMTESSQLSSLISKAFDAHKINIAALGNLVPQLHVHHIVRYTGDASWPAPVWGAVPVIPYEKGQLNRVTGKISEMLPNGFIRMPGSG